MEGVDIGAILTTVLNFLSAGSSLNYNPNAA